MGFANWAATTLRESSTNRPASKVQIAAHSLQDTALDFPQK
jgi:hypothetical protein